MVQENIFIRVGRFLGLVGFDGNLSLTNIVVYVVIVKIALSPAASPADWGALLVAMLNYAHKRSVVAAAPTGDAVTKQDLEVLAGQITQVKEGLSSVEDLKARVSRLGMSIGFSQGVSREDRG